MARVTAEQAARKWAQRTAAATEDYRQGVQRVTQAPGQAAAAKVDTYRDRTMQAVNKWQRKVAAVPLGDWQQMTMTKGAANIATGVQAAQPKMANAMSKVLSDVDAVVAQVKSMPNTTLDQRIARASAFARGMHQRAQGQGG